MCARAGLIRAEGGIARTGQGGRRGRAESGAADHRGDEDGDLGGSAHGRPRRQAACSREHRCKGRRTARRDQVEQRYCCHKYSKTGGCVHLPVFYSCAREMWRNAALYFGQNDKK